MIKLNELPYATTIGENGLGVSVTLDGGEVWENADFSTKFFDVKDLNNKSKKAIGILYDVLRSHLSRGRGEAPKFHSFEFPLVVSKDFAPKDFLDLWTTTSLGFYQTFGTRLLWEYAEKKAEHVADVLEPTESVDYKTVHIFECSGSLWECVYSPSLDKMADGIFPSEVYDDAEKRQKRESSKITEEKAKAKKQEAEKIAEEEAKKIAEEEAESNKAWNSKACKKLIDVFQKYGVKLTVEKMGELEKDIIKVLETTI